MRENFQCSWHQWQNSHCFHRAMHSHRDLILFLKIPFETSVNETEVWLGGHYEYIRFWHMWFFSQIFHRGFLLYLPKSHLWFPIPQPVYGAPCCSLALLKRRAWNTADRVRQRCTAKSQEAIVKEKIITLRASKHQNRLLCPSIAVLRNRGTSSNTEDSHAVEQNIDLDDLQRPFEAFFLFLWSLKGLDIPD